MDTTPSDPSHAAATHRPGQACDRCRKKKIKCDGSFPTCRSCAKGGFFCEVSATLRRNTKVRGFTSDEQRLVQLQEELTKCKQLLQSEKERNKFLEQEISRSEQTRSALETDSLAPRPAESVASRQNGRRQNDDPTYMIKHMGRLVHDEMDIGRFAGSTTGIHFVLSVEQQCQKVLNLSSSFPESCFRLFLAQTSPTSLNWVSESLPMSRGDIASWFTHPASFYFNQVDLFINEWEAFCPVIVRKQLKADIQQAIKDIHDPRKIQNIDYATILTLFIILIINGSESGAGTQTFDLEHSACISNALANEVCGRGDIKSLQSLVLFAFYTQLNGHCLTMTKLNGMLVSLAHSLGLHRHSRRFKMKPCEVELRRRLWWWVYTFDVVTSLLHGLPSLINDVDVDNDMPVDCHISDLDSAELSHPLPGERTAVFVFIQYVNLGKILSRTREMLYTTTQRRNGAAKIHDLNLSLRMWNQNLKMNGIDFNIGVAPSPDTMGEPVYEVEQTTLWLQLLANVAMVLVHRPGLSFDDTTVEFAKCVQSCVASSDAILSLLKDCLAPPWLRNLSLVGPSMVFQSALMQVYCHCYCLSVDIAACPVFETGNDWIQTGISILQKDVANSQYSGSHSPFCQESINEVVATLRMLESLMAQTRQIPRDIGPTMYQDILGQVPQALDDQSWSTNALGALNYVIPTDWMYEVPGPFMGCMDFDGP